MMRMTIAAFSLIAMACSGGPRGSSADSETDGQDDADAADTEDPEGVSVWITHGTVKIFAADPPEEAGAITISAAGNEFEPFQVAVRSEAPLGDVDMSISDFTGTAGSIPAGGVTIYLEGTVNVPSPSTEEGGTGDWPDILVPKVDPYYGEARSFFPFDVEAGVTRAVWFDVFVPAGTAAGDYSATVAVTSAGEVVAEPVVTLHVWDFDLPSTSSYTTAFGLGMDTAYQGHYGDVWSMGGMATVEELHTLYMKAGLRHRLSFSPMPIQWGTWDDIAGTYPDANFSYFDSTLAAFFPAGATDIELVGATITAITFDLGALFYGDVVAAGGCATMTEPPPGLLRKAEARAYLIASHLGPDAREIASVLPLDEPGGGEVGCGSSNPELDYATVRAVADILHGEGLRVQITKSRVNELLNTTVDPPRNDYIDVWIAPFMRVVGHDWDWALVDNRPLYEEDILAGAELWWYQSCMTHGCGITGGSEYAGYPQYQVDFAAMYNRVFPWMGFRYGIAGELYYAVAGGYMADPWSTVFSPSYHGNGDGTFFYPGVPDVSAAGLPDGERGASTPSIGGTHHIPLPSIRLMLMREGLEDYEYLHLLSEIGDDAFSMERCEEVVENTWTFTHDPTILFSAREAVAGRIEELL